MKNCNVIAAVRTRIKSQLLIRYWLTRDQDTIFLFMRLILVFILTLSLCCNDTGKKFPLLFPAVNPISQPEGDEPDNPVTPPMVDPLIMRNSIKLSLLAGNSLKFYDGNQMWTWKTGAIQKAGNGLYSAENVLYNLDDKGEVAESKHLITVPDKISLTKRPVVAMMANTIKIGESDTWIVENVPPEEAAAAGALYKNYTRVYMNNIEHGKWLDRCYEVEKMVVHKNDIFVRIPTGAWHHLNGDKKNIRIVVENGFAVWDHNATTKTAVIDNINISYLLNFFNAANYWLKSGATWYSQNGYSWDGATLTENGLIMELWRKKPYPHGYQEAPVIISAGTHFENGEDVLYWIECNSGQVVRHIMSVNQMAIMMRLYPGDGLRTTGLYYQNRLKPIIVEDFLYFNFDDNTYRYDFKTGLTSLFASGVGEVMKY